MLLASVVPVKTGVVLLVMLSELDEPLSVRLVISGVLGAATLVSIVIESPEDDVDDTELPSTCKALM